MFVITICGRRAGQRLGRRSSGGSREQLARPRVRALCPECPGRGRLGGSARCQVAPVESSARGHVARRRYIGKSARDCRSTVIRFNQLLITLVVDTLSLIIVSALCLMILNRMFLLEQMTYLGGIRYSPGIRLNC